VGRRVGDPDDRPLTAADIIVALDEALALSRVGLLGIVDRHLVGRPDLATGNVRAPQAADRREALIGLDDGLAVRVVPGNDPPYFQRHALLLCRYAVGPMEQGLMAGAEPIDNRIFVLILQHPREKKEALSTAALTRAMLSRAGLAVGLSWPNLSQALGHRVDTRRWAVLYLGSARPTRLGPSQEVIALDRRGEPAADQQAMLRGIDGVVLLDGSWKEAKTLWWRNPWLLKLRRLVLNPQHPSRYGRIRREPRREALSTLEATALLLKHLEGHPGIEAGLLGALDRLLTEASEAAHPGEERVSR
jgi:DTW domain-containing protein